MFYFIEHGTLYNYADGNTLSFSCPDFNRLIQVLQSESLILIIWFHDNCCRTTLTNLKPLQHAWERLFDINLEFKISDTEIKCEEVVKLLGVDIEYKLTFA